MKPGATGWVRLPSSASSGASLRKVLKISPINSSSPTIEFPWSRLISRCQWAVRDSRVRAAEARLLQRLPELSSTEDGTWLPRATVDSSAVCHPRFRKGPKAAAELGRDVKVLRALPEPLLLYGHQEGTGSVRCTRKRLVSLNIQGMEVG